MTARRGLLGLLLVAVAVGILGQANNAMGLPEYDLVLATTVLFWMAQSTSWNLLSGYAGYFSFGQGAYVAVGAYATAVLTGRHGGSFFLSIPIGGLIGGVLAAIVGAIAFRLRLLRGEIFALLTLAVPFVLAAYARISGAIDGGQGTTIQLPSFPSWVGDFQHLLFLLNLVLATLAVGVALAIYHTRFGRGLAAVHDAEAAAEVLGVPTFRYKMLAIIIGGVLGGLSGAVFALQIGFVSVDSVFSLTIPLTVILISVLGGRRHWLGPVLGALLIETLQDRLTAGGLERWSAIILGGLLAVLVVIAPDGLLGRLRSRRWLAVAVFVVVTAAMIATGYWDQIDALLYGMLAAVAVATIADRVRPRKAPPPAATTPAPDPVGNAAPIESISIAQPGPPLDNTPTAAAPPTPADRRQLVSCAGVTRYFGGVRALEDVSFEVGGGEIVGLVGPNGSGKTTMINLLSGALQPTRGRIQILGQPTAGLAPHRVAHAGVARTYQIPKPLASMTVRDNVAMAVMFGRTRAGLGAARVAAERHLATVRLGHLADALPDALNLHQRQLLEMARAIAADPTVLLLDEALAGLNPAEIDDAVAVIRRIHESGISIIIVEHLLRVLNLLATRIVVLDRGTLIADGSPATVLADPAVVRAYLGRQRA
jgi:branched-chain amino acid transport system permease protein